MTNNISLHIGMTKAGGHLLYEHLFPALKDANFLDMKVSKSILSDVFFANSGDYDMLVRTEQIQDRLNALFDENKLNIIFGPEFVCSASDIAATAERAARLFGGAKVTFFIRNQYTWIRSYYLEMMRPEFYKKLKYQDINDWAEEKIENGDQNPFPALNYFQVVQKYKALFGVEKVGVFLFEDMCREPEKFQHELCRFLEVVPPEGNIIASQRPNASMSARQLAVVRALSMVFPNANYTRLRSFMPASARRFLNSFLKSGAKPSVELTPAIKEKINALYAPENIKLATAYNLKLAEAGYPLGKANANTAEFKP
jgi:hypothetical protein